MVSWNQNICVFDESGSLESNTNDNNNDIIIIIICVCVCVRVCACVRVRFFCVSTDECVCSVSLTVDTCTHTPSNCVYVCVPHQYHPLLHWCCVHQMSILMHHIGWLSKGCLNVHHHTHHHTWLMSCRVVSCRVMSCDVMWCDVVSCQHYCQMTHRMSMYIQEYVHHVFLCICKYDAVILSYAKTTRKQHEHNTNTTRTQ